MSDLSIEERIVAALRRIIRAVDLHSRRLHERHGLTGPQLATLQAAERLEAASAGTLARAVHLSHPTVTGILTRLERRGLVRRARGEHDRRTVTVRVTSQGRDLLANAPSLLQEEFRQGLARLEDWENSMILATLQRIASMMDAQDLDAAPHLFSGATPDTASKPAPEPERDPTPVTEGNQT
jgi:DNA-binding MarR family transcriptional regulator